MFVKVYSYEQIEKERDTRPAPFLYLLAYPFVFTLKHNSIIAFCNNMECTLFGKINRVVSTYKCCFYPLTGKSTDAVQKQTQAVQNTTAENREININNTNKINDGGKKQASPAPKFYF